MKRLATRLVDVLIVASFAIAVYLLSQPSSPIRASWARYRIHRAQVKAAVRLWPTLLASATPLNSSASDVQVIEIADYGCPFCRQVQPVIDSAMVHGVRVAYLNYPLPEHENAEGAALAAMCALKVGKFRPMHDRLIRSTRWQADADWGREALAVGITDTVEFSRCMDQDVNRIALQHEKALAESVFVQGTPTFVTRNDVFTGTLTADQLAVLVTKKGAR